MPTASVTCTGCSQATSFEYPKIHTNPVIKWDCPSCGTVNALEFPDNRAAAEAAVLASANEALEGVAGVQVVTESDSGSATQAAR